MVVPGKIAGKSASMRVDSVNASELSGGDIAAWRSLLSADPELSSPYLTPEWTQLVAHHRADVRVAVFRDAHGEPVGFVCAFAAQGVEGWEEETVASVAVSARTVCRSRSGISSVFFARGSAQSSSGNGVPS
jgi:hypothetical protein